jgi:hypothetical protein
MIRDAVANAIIERWPEAKITDTVDSLYEYGGQIKDFTSNNQTRINVELPSVYESVAIRVASIDIDGEDIRATFYGGGEYSNNLFHPKSLTDLEDLLEGHIQSVGIKTKDVRPKRHG